MSREDSIMSFQGVYDAFQCDFHRTPQKIMTVRNRHTHLKSTVESNKTNVFSNCKSLDEEDEQDFRNQSKQPSENQNKHPINNDCLRDNCNISHVNNSSIDTYNKMSPYDIEFDVFGNSLYESQQEYFIKTIPQQNYHSFLNQNTPSYQIMNSNYPLTNRFKFETSLDNIYITEDNFESMEDEDKENKDPLENPQQIQSVCEDQNVEDHLQYNQEVELEQICQTRFDNQSPYNRFQNSKNVIEVDQINRNLESFQDEDLITKGEVRSCKKSILVNYSHHQKFIEKNLMTPLQCNQNKGVYEMQSKVQNDENTEEIEVEEIVSYNLLKEQEIKNNIFPLQQQNIEGSVVKFKSDLETVIPFTQNNFSEYEMNENNSEYSNNIYKIRLDSITASKTLNNNNINNNSNTQYYQHLLYSSSQTNRLVRNQQSSTNRTPLRDITSSSISSAKKNYQGVKKMLEFSSPKVNRWDLKTAQKSTNKSQKYQQKSSSSKKKVTCTPAIFCR